METAPRSSQNYHRNPTPSNRSWRLTARVRYLGGLEHRGRDIPGETGPLARPLVGALVRVLGEPLRLHCRLRNPNWSLHPRVQSGGDFRVELVRDSGWRSRIGAQFGGESGGGNEAVVADEGGGEARGGGGLVALPGLV